MTFRTLFPFGLLDVHFTKDVGMVPHWLGHRHGFDSSIVTFPVDETFPGHKTEAFGTGIDLIPHPSRRFDFGARCRFLKYLVQKARKIDVLNLYYWGLDTYVAGLLYKWLNPGGFLFVKLDMGKPSLERYRRQSLARPWFLRFAYDRIYPSFLRAVDLVGAETNEACSYLVQEHPELKSKVLAVPGGFDCERAKELIPRRRTFAEKENLILTVGRIGAEYKNHQLLLDALSGITHGDFRVIFVGAEVDGFQEKVTACIRSNPHLAGKLEFTGEIADRKELYHLYDRARCLVISSKTTRESVENYPLVLSQALYFGNYVVGTTDVPAMQDICSDARLACQVAPDDPKALAVILENVISETRNSEPQKIGAHCEARHQYVQHHLSWEKITRKIAERIRGNDFTSSA